MTHKISAETYNKFRIDALMVKDYDYWMLLTRTAQVTLGSLVLINKTGAEDFGKLSPYEVLEMGEIITELEVKLKDLFNYDKINYQMLRMKDPEVHFHIIPRYAKYQEFNGKTFFDQHWPTAFSLKNENKITDDELMEIHQYIKEGFR